MVWGLLTPEAFQAWHLGKEEREVDQGTLRVGVGPRGRKAACLEAGTFLMAEVPDLEREEQHKSVAQPHIHHRYFHPSQGQPKKRSCRVRP
jgi:hypothetical protein